MNDHQAQLHADLDRYTALDNLFDAIVDGGFVDADSDDLRGDPQRLARHLVDTILDDPDYLVTLPKVKGLADCGVVTGCACRFCEAWRKALGR